jgi:hypothetical protein
MTCSHYHSCPACQRTRSEELASITACLVAEEEKTEALKFECESLLEEMKRMTCEVDHKRRIIERLSASLRKLNADHQKLKKDTIVAERYSRECAVKQIELENTISDLQLRLKASSESGAEDPPFEVEVLNQVVEYLLNALRGF